MREPLSSGFRSEAIRPICGALLFGPMLWQSAANAGQKYALVDQANNIVLQEEFDDHPPVPSGGLRWLPLILDLKVPNEHGLDSARTYYFGPDRVVISNTIDEKSH